MPNITNIPSPRVPFIDQRTGEISREWYRFLLNLFQLTGGGTNDISLVDQALAPNPQDPVATVATLVDQLTLGRVPQELILPDDLTPPHAETVIYDDLSPSPELGTMAGQNAEKVAITGGTVIVDGGATLMGTKAALTNGAAAAAGTLLNAPAAGNPTKWVAINDAGTIRYIPAW